MIKEQQVVRVKWTDALGQTLNLPGITLYQNTDKRWRVNIGGMAVLVEEKDITVVDEAETKEGTGE